MSEYEQKVKEERKTKYDHLLIESRKQILGNLWAAVFISQPTCAGLTDVTNESGRIAGGNSIESLASNKRTRGYS